MSTILYISYDGMLEPLGQSQVLAYLKPLTVGRRIYLISFEKKEDWGNFSERERIAREIAGAGIIWHPMRYHKRPSAIATMWDILRGIVLSLWLVLRFKVSIVHARSYVPPVIALVLKQLSSVKYIFDMRGFWADERVDGGLWPKNGYLYRTAKWLERRFLISADRVVSLTTAAVVEMKHFPYLQGRIPIFEVITTCTDLELFKPDEFEIASEKVAKPFTIGYVGSVGVSYLSNETLECFKIMIQEIPDAQLFILNRGDHNYIYECLTRHHINLDAVRIEVTDHVGVASAMRQMDAGIFFIKQTYSKMASAPTKLGELLGSGIPCLANVGVGDMAAILEGERVGIALKDFSETSMRGGIKQLLKLTREPKIRQRCRDAALRHFSLEIGVQKYANIYSELLQVE